MKLLSMLIDIDWKNVLDDAMRGLAPRLLNLAVVKVSQHNLIDMVEL